MHTPPAPLGDPSTPDPSSTTAGDERTRSMSVRVPPEDVAAIDALRPLYPGADGRAATRSEVLRAFLALAMPALGDLEQHRRLRRLASSLRRPIGEVLRDVFARGLDALEAAR